MDPYIQETLVGVFEAGLFDPLDLSTHLQKEYFNSPTEYITDLLNTIEKPLDFLNWDDRDKYITIFDKLAQMSYTMNYLYNQTGGDSSIMSVPEIQNTRIRDNMSKMKEEFDDELAAHVSDYITEHQIDNTISPTAVGTGLGIKEFISRIIEKWKSIEIPLTDKVEVQNDLINKAKEVGYDTRYRDYIGVKIKRLDEKIFKLDYRYARFMEEYRNILKNPNIDDTNYERVLSYMEKQQRRFEGKLNKLDSKLDFWKNYGKLEKQFRKAGYNHPVVVDEDQQKIMDLMPMIVQQRIQEGIQKLNNNPLFKIVDQSKKLFTKLVGMIPTPVVKTFEQIDSIYNFVMKPYHLIIDKMGGVMDNLVTKQAIGLVWNYGMKEIVFRGSSMMNGQAAAATFVNTLENIGMTMMQTGLTKTAWDAVSAFLISSAAMYGGQEIYKFYYNPEEEPEETPQDPMDIEPED